MAKRVQLSVRIRPTLKEKFLRIIEKEGLSTCVVVEAMLSAWVAAYEHPKELVSDESHSITVIQNFKRIVSRARRHAAVKRREGSHFWQYGRYMEVGADGEIHETNRYVNPPGMWIYDPDA